MSTIISMKFTWILLLLVLFVATETTNGFQFPTSGSFRISPVSSRYEVSLGFNQQHEVEWRGLFQLFDGGRTRIFAQSLESPLSILMQNGKAFLVIPHQNTSCIQVEYNLGVEDEIMSGIQKSLAMAYKQMIVPGVRMENWKESSDMKLAELTGCRYGDRVFVNLLNQDYSNDALIACVNDKQVPYRIRSKNVMIEIRETNDQDVKLFEKVKNISETCVKHNSTPQKQYQKELTIKNKKLVWFLESKVSDLLKDLNKLNLKNNGTKRVCIFLHGAGVQNEGVPLHDWPHYWGKVNSFTEDICSERWFIRRNTKDHGWTSEYLQTSYCELALIGNKNDTKSKIIKNSIVFTHSMANMIFPTAMYKGYCQLDLETSTWVSLSAPFNGSPAAIYLKTLCYQYVHKTAPGNMQKIMDFIAEVTGNCDGENPVMADATLLPNYCDPNTTNYHGKKPMCLGDPIFSYAEPMISARLCGSSPFGLVSYYGVALELFAELVQYGEPNDGLVPVSSCFMTTNPSSFVGNFTSSLYNAAINHSDGTCRNGDSTFSEVNKMPCAFFGIYRSPVQRK